MTKLFVYHQLSDDTLKVIGSAIVHVMKVRSCVLLFLSRASDVSLPLPQNSSVPPSSLLLPYLFSSLLA